MKEKSNDEQKLSYRFCVQKSARLFKKTKESARIRATTRARSHGYVKNYPVTIYRTTLVAVSDAEQLLNVVDDVVEDERLRGGSSKSEEVRIVLHRTRVRALR